ncbi:MAG: endonuclease III, partial [Clostridia bacterium]|nr:endonuclease III [Clostridia bacterium]
TPALFKKYPTAFDLANAKLEEVESLIKRIGLYRNKAKNIIALSKILVANFNGEVPSRRDDLESLPGVGRKTTNVVLSVAFDYPALAVDTHVLRVSKRLKLAKKDDTALDVERKLCRIIPRERWTKSHHQFIFFGRYFCKATSPNCRECPLFDLCQDEIKYKRKEENK